VKEPILKFAFDDETFWWVLQEKPTEWVVCFAATYASELKKKKELLVWRIEGIGPDEKNRIRRELKRQAGAKHIVHLCIYRVIKPLTEGEIEFINIINRQIKAEQEKKQMVAF
jgi:hypothetical protein